MMKHFVEMFMWRRRPWLKLPGRLILSPVEDLHISRPNGPLVIAGMGSRPAFSKPRTTTESNLCGQCQSRSQWSSKPRPRRL